MTKNFNILFSAWVVALVATLGSMFFSEVMGYPPCSLCWYQRICMYPLVLILAAGLFPPDEKVFRFAMPLAVVGWLIAAYHNLLHWQIIPESAAPCRSGVPCSTVYIEWLGFITIPLMSMVAFSLVLFLILKFNTHSKRN